MSADDGLFVAVGMSWLSWTRAVAVEWTVQICCERVSEKVRGERLEAVTTVCCEEEQRNGAVIFPCTCRFSQSASEQSKAWLTIRLSHKQLP